MLDYLIDSNIIWFVGVVLAFILVIILNKLAEKYTWNFLIDYENEIREWAIEQGQNQAKRENAIKNIIDKLVLFLPTKVKFFAVIIDFVSKFTPIDSLVVKLVKGLNALYGDLLDLLDDGENNDSIK